MTVITVIITHYLYQTSSYKIHRRSLNHVLPKLRPRSVRSPGTRTAPFHRHRHLRRDDELTRNMELGIITKNGKISRQTCLTIARFNLAHFGGD